MLRDLTIAAALLTSLAVSAPASPFRVGVQPQPKKGSGSPDRAKLIKEIQADYDHVLDSLNKADAGAQTRKKQKRIIEGLDKLLEHEDPAPNANSSSAPKPSRSSNPPAPPKAAPQPKSLAQPKSQQAPPGAAAKTQTPRAVSRSRLPDTLEALRKEREFSGGWSPDMPRRHRQTLDAFARERFPRGFEELLRAYYRTLAEARPDELQK